MEHYIPGMASPLIPEEDAEGASGTNVASGRSLDKEVVTTLPGATSEDMPAAEEVAEEPPEALPDTEQGTYKA